MRIFPIFVAAGDDDPNHHFVRVDFPHRAFFVRAIEVDSIARFQHRKILWKRAAVRRSRDADDAAP